MKDKIIKDLPMKPAYEFGKLKGLNVEVDEIRKKHIRPGWIYRGRKSGHTTRVKRGYIVVLFEANSIFDEFKKKHWQFGTTESGKTHRDWYVDIKTAYDAYEEQNP